VRPIRRAAYIGLTRLAILPWAFGMLSLALAYRLALLAYRTDPTMDAPNCWVWAAVEWSREYRAWAEAGYPPGREPYGVVRGSRSQPKWVLHALVGMRDPDSGLMDLTSFKPTAASDAPWWAFWQRTRFDGRAERGD
jgi:hypothetical protein